MDKPPVAVACANNTGMQLKLKLKLDLDLDQVSSSTGSKSFHLDRRMSSPRKKVTVLRLRQRLREVRLHPKPELVRFVHKLKGILVAVFVGNRPGPCEPQHDSARAAPTPSRRHHPRFVRSDLLSPPRHTPPGYQSIRCVTPSELEQGLHDDAPPGVPFQQYFPYRSYEDLRAAEDGCISDRQLQAIEELRDARRRASSTVPQHRLMSDRL